MTCSFGWPSRTIRIRCCVIVGRPSCALTSEPRPYASYQTSRSDYKWWVSSRGRDADDAFGIMAATWIGGRSAERELLSLVRGPESQLPQIPLVITLNPSRAVRTMSEVAIADPRTNHVGQSPLQADGVKPVFGQTYPSEPSNYVSYNWFGGILFPLSRTSYA